MIEGRARKRASQEMARINNIGDGEEVRPALLPVRHLWDQFPKALREEYALG
jgi:hypothetical protein